ncbi:SRPBCC family protein [Leucobacter sp. USCH14]|uniref:SRPBCC family protein n=1 Tax=Leucobacter sp. USCH14 TaxID=3024838 RepID=UPI00309C9FC2
MPASLTFEDSIHVEAEPSAVYAVVSDVTRTGEWSPTCRECWWDEDHGPRPGAWFTGLNATPDREWKTRSQVVVAEPGVAFGWSVGPGRVVWTYRMEPSGSGTRLTESWEFTSEGQAYFVERFGEHAADQVTVRSAAAREDIPATLAALKRIIEQ